MDYELCLLNTSVEQMNIATHSPKRLDRANYISSPIKKRKIVNIDSDINSTVHEKTGK
jgi:hypothetical protein